MTPRKKVRYGELTPIKPISAVPHPVPRSRAPTELARALAEARAAEAAIPAPAPGLESVSGFTKVPAAVTRVGGAVPLRERVRGRSGTVSVLVFRVGEERFAVELGRVEEVMDVPTIHHVPEMTAAMRGVISVRGALTPVYEPDAALRVSHSTGDCALVVRRERSRIALIVDDVDDVLTLNLTDVSDAPADAAETEVLLGVLRHERQLLALIDADALIAVCQGALTAEPT